MKHKKLLALLLASVMCLTACATGKESTSVENATESTEEAASETKNYWEMLDEVADTSELPDWTGEKLDINVWVAGGTDAIFGTISENDVVFKEIERVTGVTFNVDESFGNGGESLDAKLPRVMISEDFPTLIFGWDIDTQLKELWDRGYLADLTEYYEDGTLSHFLKWLPLEEMDTMLYSHMKDEKGSYYKLPQVDVAAFYEATGYAPEEYDGLYYQTYKKTPASEGNGNYYWGVSVRDDILKALYPDAYSAAELKQIYMENGTFAEEQIYDIGLNSKEDFIKFLNDIKALLGEEEFKALNGSAVEVTYGPNTDADNYQWCYRLSNVVAGFPAVDYFTVAERDNESGAPLLTRGIDSEPMVEWMKDLNKLVNDDVISKNSLVDNSATFDEKILNGNYAVIYGKDPNTVDGNAEGWAYRPVWVKADFTENYYGFNALPTIYSYAVFKDAVPEGQMDQLMHFVDYMSSEVGINNIYWGPATAGLFTEDADGNRTYTDEAIAACMINGEDTKISAEYGLMNNRVSERAFYHIPLCGAESLYEPKYLVADQSERNESNTYLYYNPGILEGRSFGETAVSVVANNQVYGLGASVEGLAEFWAARAGFENQMKKVIVATSEDAFDAELETLRQYADENGMTKEAMDEYNKLFIEVNGDALKAAGVID